MANILFIAYDFSPILSPESIQVQRRAITLANNGHRVIVLTSHANPAFEFIDESLVGEHERIEVIRTKKPYFEKLLNLFYKFYDLTDRKLWWKSFAYKKAKEILKDFKIDFLYTHSTPLVDHLIGLEIKKKYPYLRWIAHFSDPWTLNPYKNYRFMWQFKLNRKYEKEVLKNCNLLTVTSQKTKELFENEFSFLKNKVKILPHTYDESLYKNYDKKSKKVIIVHTGNIYGLRTIRYLLEAIKELDLKNVEFHFYGKIKKDEVELVKKNKLESIVKIFKQVGYFKSIDIISKADFLLVVDAPLKNSPFFPSKLADYIGAKKPIIALTMQDSTTVDILKHINNDKMIADSNNKEEIKMILKRLEYNIDFKNINYYNMKNYTLLKEIFEK